MPDAAAGFDHPIFCESIWLIRQALDPSLLSPFTPLEQEVLLRLIHSSGDLSLAADLRCSPGACAAGAAALAAGAPLLTDTAMAAAAVAPMAQRTFGNAVHSVLAWAPARAPQGGTRTAVGMALALQQWPGAVVLIGSAPTALEQLLALVAFLSDAQGTGDFLGPLLEGIGQGSSTAGSRAWRISRMLSLKIGWSNPAAASGMAALGSRAVQTVHPARRRR